MGKEIVTQVQENQRVPKRINPRWNTPRHILIKLTKIRHKEQILKAARERQQITHKGIPIRITANHSIETLQDRRDWQDILKVMKEKNLQSRLLYPARIAGSQCEELRPWQRSWGRRRGIRKGRIEPQETPCSQASTHKTSLPPLLLYALTYTSDFMGGYPPPPLSVKELT